MITDSIERFSKFGVWASPVPDFLRRPPTLRWLTVCQEETRKSDDETVLVLLAAMRALNLTILDGSHGADALGQFLEEHGEDLQKLCQANRVQANVAERALPILEVLGERWGRQRLHVTELGSSFGLIGRVLVSAPQVLQNFGRYFAAGQQRPEDVALVTGYQGIDLAPPDERWLLACIPLPDLRTRVARLVYEIPAGPRFSVTQGSAFDDQAWPRAPEGTVPILLTSFMLYQLPGDHRRLLEEKIRNHTSEFGGTWINLDVFTVGDQSEFVLQEDGKTVLRLENDLCVRWWRHED